MIIRKKNKETMLEMREEIESFLRKYESGGYDTQKPPLSARALGSLKEAIKATDEEEFFRFIGMVGHEMGKIEVHYGLSLYLENE